MELKHHNPRFHGIRWNFVQIQSSMEVRRIPRASNFPQKVTWNSMELFLEFNGMKLDDLKEIIVLNIVFGIWLIITCYSAIISRKCYILHCFQHHNAYFEYSSVNENGRRPVKIACCLMLQNYSDIVILSSSVNYTRHANIKFQTAMRKCEIGNCNQNILGILSLTVAWYILPFMLVQDCNISSALAMELLQPCIDLPSEYTQCRNCAHLHMNTDLP